MATPQLTLHPDGHCDLLGSAPPLSRVCQSERGETVSYVMDHRRPPIDCIRCTPYQRQSIGGRTARDKQQHLSRALREDLRRFGRTFSLALLRLKVFWSDVATDRASISDRGRVACNPFS